MALTTDEEETLKLMIQEKQARVKLDTSNEQTEAIVRPLRTAWQTAEAALKEKLK